jgi:hypothetical protein
MRFTFALLGALALTSIAPVASAESPPPLAGATGGREPARPKTLPYNDDEPTPYGYRPVSRYRYGLIIGGALTFSTLYIPTAALSASYERVLVVPIVGPFIRAGQVAGAWSSVSAAILVLDGLGQAAGAAMLIAGLAHKKQLLVRDDFASVRVTPMILGPGAAGIGIVGAM